MSLVTTTYRLANKLLHSATSCIDELTTLETLLKDDYRTLTGCEYDSSCILPACTAKSTECNDTYDCSTLNVTDSTSTPSCDIIVQES